MSDWVDPAAAFLRLAAEEPWAVWLDAGPNARADRSYIGIPRSRVLSDDVETGLVTSAMLVDGFTANSYTQSATIFEVLRESLAAEIVEDIESPGFHLGWVGWFGYELAAHTTGVRTQASSTPDARLVFLDRALEFDHEAHTVTLLELAQDPTSWHAELETVLAPVMSNDAVRSLATLEQLTQPAPSIPNTRVTWRHSPEHYESLVDSCLAAITFGDAYQLCLTNEVRIAAGVGEPLQDPVQTYLRLRAENPSHHGGLLRFGDVALLSSTPEVFLSISAEGEVRTKPIKGTRRRGDSAQADQALARELVQSEKERAENLMIVDLMRNDLGRVAQLGSVNVDSLLEVETYEHVHQLVSTISARLLPGMSATDALEACFPAGSMTGAPKISAMKILAELEQGPRGIYSGAFGYLGLDGAAELAMVIRSIVLDSSGASIGTGGGITSGSIPREELEETWVKVAPLLRALGVSTLDYS
ncbi:MAG: anthranilate synthase component I family protein [Actinomycetales bacterium]|nr:anthranilate synthase component I family protein [Actinomycetales bacterium]